MLWCEIFTHVSTWVSGYVQGCMKRCQDTPNKVKEVFMKSLKWFAFAGLVSLSAACGGVSDDDLLKDLEEDEVTELCEEVCADAADYELVCGEGDSMITYSGEKGDCAASCEMVKSVKDSCSATVEDLRVATSTPTTCDEGAASFGAALKLTPCF